MGGGGSIANMIKTINENNRIRRRRGFHNVRKKFEIRASIRQKDDKPLSPEEFRAIKKEIRLEKKKERLQFILSVILAMIITFFIIKLIIAFAFTKHINYPIPD